MGSKINYVELKNIFVNREIKLKLLSRTWQKENKEKRKKDEQDVRRKGDKNF